MPITRVEQLEQALEHAREMIADLQRRHEMAERLWAADYVRHAHERERLQQRIDWLESRIASDIIVRSKRWG